MKKAIRMLPRLGWSPANNNTVPFNPALRNTHSLSKAVDEEYLMRLSEFAYLPDMKRALFDFSPSAQRDADHDLR